MARKASGADQLKTAKEALRTAKTADDLRLAQAVLLPLELGLSLKQTAKAIGRSVGATCNMRTRYCKVARNGWRKLAPDTAHPQGNAAIREDWEKNFRGSWCKS